MADEAAPRRRLAAVADRADVRIGALAAVLALAAFDLFWRLGSADWHFDEFLYGRDGWLAIHARQPAPDHPLLGKYLIGIGELVLGRNVIGVRIVPVLSSLVAIGLVFGFVRRLAGWWTGVLAAALWAGLPRGLVVAGEVTGVVRLDRYGLLDTMANAVGIGALYAIWHWSERPSWRRAAVAGVVFGATVAIKLNWVVLGLGAVVLAVLVVRPALVAVGHLVLMAATALALFAATYLPFGTQGPHMVHTMIEVQRRHADLGHVSVASGSVWYREPWWTNLSYWSSSQGVLVILALLGGAAAACWHRQRAAVVYLFAIVLAMAGALMASPVALAHYWVAWLGPLLVLAALGTAELVRRPGLPRLVGVAIVAVFVVRSAQATWAVATIDHGPYGRMVAAVERGGPPPSKALVLGTDLGAYFPGIDSPYAGFAYAPGPVELVVIEHQFEVAMTPQALKKLRDTARASGLHPHVVGDLEYWDRHP